jgi:SAM-dependent methyltransferase
MRPNFAVPPPDLAFDAYNHVDWPEYYEGGLKHAQVFADIIRVELPTGPLRILEWGCGPGRIIRHLPELLGDREPRLTGADYNPRSIGWCQAALPGMDFVTNQLNPPLPFADGAFDAAYNFSVFTHLSEAVQKAWAAELLRVLRPGGLLICTTHGGAYRYLLTGKDEQARFDAGQVVTQDGYAEGKKWYFAIHPHPFVRDVLLGAFEDVRQASPSADRAMLQDVWVCRKPGPIPVPPPMTAEAQ